MSLFWAVTLLLPSFQYFLCFPCRSTWRISSSYSSTTSFSYMPSIATIFSLTWILCYWYLYERQTVKSFHHLHLWDSCARLFSSCSWSSKSTLKKILGDYWLFASPPHTFPSTFSFWRYWIWYHHSHSLPISSEVGTKERQWKQRNSESDGAVYNGLIPASFLCYSLHPS